MKKFVYEAPMFNLELVDEDIITFSYEETDNFPGEEIPGEG